MTFNKGNRKATTSKQIKVEAGDPPAITIKPQKESKENPTTVTMIKAVAKSTMASTNVTWECVQEDGYAFIDLSVAENVLTKVKFTFTKAPGKATASRSFALVIPANALSEGVNYKFRLTVAHKDSTAYAETVITTNAAPTIGKHTDDDGVLIMIAVLMIDLSVKHLMNIIINIMNIIVINDIMIVMLLAKNHIAQADDGCGNIDNDR